VKHSQDRGTAIQRALNELLTDNPDALEYAIERIREGKERRDLDREVAATDLYAELRLFTKEQLAVRAGYSGPKQQLIASIIEQELP